MLRPIILSIAGSDPCGGAGVQADARMIWACGGRPATVIATLTAQNSQRFVGSYPVSVDVLSAQLHAVMEDLPVAAIKVGALGNAENVRLVANFCKEAHVPCVVDPVLNATLGGALCEGDDVVQAYYEFANEHVVITPNGDELAQLNRHSRRGDRPVAQALLHQGFGAILHTGGDGQELCVDTLYTRDSQEHFSSKRIQGDIHGTGCVFSSAIATYLGMNMPLRDAVEQAKQAVNHAMMYAVKIGHGRAQVEP